MTSRRREPEDLAVVFGMASSTEPSPALLEALLVSSRWSPLRPHPVTLHSYGGVTAWVGAEEFAWWLFVYDAARVSRGISGSSLLAGESSADESKVRKHVKRRRRWWRWCP